VTLLRSTIRHNAANRDCGGICTYGASLLLTDTLIESNTALRYAGGIGGVHDITITSSTIISNTARVDGGGIFNNDRLTIQHSALVGNRAPYGYGGGIVNDGGSVTITQSQLHKNYAVGGGGIANRQGPGVASLELDNVTLSSNTVDAAGGGIYNSDGSLRVSNTTLSDNAAYQGGGIFNSRVMTLSNTTLSGNRAGQVGGGINNSYGLATLTNVTLNNNSSTYGGGLKHYGGNTSQTFTLKNTIIANSTAGGNCYQDPGSRTLITSDDFNLSSDDSCMTYFNKLHDRNNTDPQLGPLAKHGGATKTHLPQTGSPAIDAGTGSGAPEADQRSFTRPQGLAVDMGAVEVCQVKPDQPILLTPANGKRVKGPRRTLDWNDADCGEKFKVVVRLGSPGGDLVQESGPLRTSSFTIKGLVTGQTYAWQVLAINSVGKTRSDWWTFTVK
jgi:hypothetical protein